MITLQTQLQLNPTVLATTLSNQETVLLHLQSNYYYSLNETGTHIWQGLSQRLTLAEISRRLMTLYAIDTSEAEQAVLALLHELTAENLVHALPTPAHGHIHG